MVVVDVGDQCVHVVAFGAVFQFLGVDESVYLLTYSLHIEVGDVEDAMLVHEMLGVGSWWSVHDDDDDIFLDFDYWVEVRHER